MPPKRFQKPEQSGSRNEYIPSFISKKPFYVADDDADPAGKAGATGGAEADYLEHQRLQRPDDPAAEQQQRWYDRGKKLGPAATRFRKGACENCGAMTHKTKECLSRPRKQGARWTGADINADEVVQDVRLGWDAKRDRWNGYDAAEYAKVVEEYNTLESMKKAMAKGGGGAGAGNLLQDGDGDGGGNDQGEGAAADDGDDAKDGLRYEEETDMGRQQSTSTRNLRMREDTAKYLLNLDLDSAKYDPKTRMMVNAGATADAAAALVAEEGLLKTSGDAAEFESAQLHAFETHQRGDRQRAHLQANPTSSEVLKRRQREEADARREAQQKALLAKYGDQSHMRRDGAPGGAAPRESHRFVEYDERGLVKRQEGAGAQARSQYPEDVMVNNHKSVWGSWWRNFVWGYACCHSTVKNSYCTGEEGIRALEETERLREMDALPAPSGAADDDDDARPDGGDGAESQQLTLAAPPTQAKGADVARKRGLAQMRDGTDDAEMEEYRKRRVLPGDTMV